MAKNEAHFWQHKTLDEMNSSEWESLCDGCGLCCLHKFEDVETEQLEYTCVKCQYLDGDRRCQVYSERTQQVPECLNVRDIPKAQYRWLPESCAYRRLHEGKQLPDWHPLLTGDTRAMIDGDYAVGEWAIPDTNLEVTEDFIVKIKLSTT